MARQYYKSGETIFAEGEHSEDAFFIISGEVEITMQTPEGPRTLARLHAGEVFGEMGMITEQPRSASARAVTAVILDSVTEEVFEEQVLQQPERLQAYLATLFDRLRKADQLVQRAWRKQSLAAPKEQPDPPAVSLLWRPADGKPEARGVPIRKSPFRIGRAQADGGGTIFARNDLSLPDFQPYHVSRCHCEIERDGDTFLVRDCGSRLGTIVNGTRLAMDAEQMTAVLQPGENKIVLGAPEGPHHYVLTLSAA